MPDMEKIIKTLTDALTAKENYPWAKAEMSFEFIEMLLELLKEQQQIVRCKDCKHRPELKLYSDRQGNYTAVEFPDGSKCPCQCEDFFYSWYPKDDWFCANGEHA